MFPFLPQLLIGIAAVAVVLGSYAEGRRAGRNACEATALAQSVRAVDEHIAALAAAQAKASALTARLAAAESQTRIVHKEIVREIPARTLGRPCLGPDALGLLDRATVQSAGLPQPAGQPADQGGASATDTQVAGWIADAIEQHERERQRCNALIEWHRG